MRRTDRTIITPFADIHLTQTDGAGFPLVLLHGAGADRTVFESQFQSQLAERHRLVAIDLPGHGQSGDAHDPATGYGITGLAQCVAMVLDEIGVSRCAMFGWSLGGHIAIELMHQRPGLIAGLMLTGAPPVARGPIGMLRAFHASWDMLLASKEKLSPRDVERYAHLSYGDNFGPAQLESIRRTDGRARTFFSRSAMRGDGAEQKRTVEEAQVPIAMVNGEHDPLIRLGYIASLDYAHLWDGQPHVLAGAGHAAFRDAPEQFNALLLRFAADAEAWRVPVAAPAALRA